MPSKCHFNIRSQQKEQKLCTHAIIVAQFVVHKKPPHLQKLMVGKVNNKYSHPIIKKKRLRSTSLNALPCYILQ